MPEMAEMRNPCEKSLSHRKRAVRPVCDQRPASACALRRVDKQGLMELPGLGAAPRLLLIAAGVAAVTGGAARRGAAALPDTRWHAPFRHSWRSMLQQSFDFGNNPETFDSPAELAVKARYSVVFLSAGTGTGGPGADPAYKVTQGWIKKHARNIW